MIMHYDMMKTAIKRLLFHKNTISPIVDKIQYPHIETSYSGGSLANSNILLITNNELFESEFLVGYFKNEMADAAVFQYDNSIDLNSIVTCGNDLIGPFTHIINIINLDKQCQLFNEDGSYYNEDVLRRVYKLLQVETDYLVRVGQYSTICCLFKQGESSESVIESEGLQFCIKGLAKVLANHNIIVNGIVDSKNVSLKKLLPAVCFLSSKYGQIMTGEVMVI